MFARLFLLLLCVSLSSLLSVHDAMSEEMPEKVGILSLSSEELSKSETRLFESSLEEGLTGLGFEIIHHSEFIDSLRGTSFISGCSMGPCTKAIFAESEIKDVITARMKREGSSYTLLITRLNTEHGDVVSQVAEVCDICTVEEAMLSVTNATIALMTETGETENNEHLEAILNPNLPNPSHEKSRIKMKRTGIALLSVGILSAVIGGGLVANSQNVYGAGLLGLGAGSVLGGAGLWTFSKKF